ncbi:MAG: hypothetical protein DMF03_05755 [Verrucomicrobia bacterium]|nr:MAG: hypothetical protein DMF03_05755 [Verrucomicrobiota bacterium]
MRDENFAGFSAFSRSIDEESLTGDCQGTTIVRRAQIERIEAGGVDEQQNFVGLVSFCLICS